MYRRVALLFLLSSIILACGPLSQINEVAQEAQEIAPTIAAEATLVAEVQESIGDPATQEGQPDQTPSEAEGDNSDSMPENACALVSEDEVGATFGTSVVETRHTQEDALATCIFDFGGGAAFSILLSNLAFESSASINYSAQSALLVPSEAVFHPGLTEGVWNEERGQLVAYTRQYFIVSSGNFERRDAVVEIAGTYGQRLP